MDRNFSSIELTIQKKLEKLKPKTKKPEFLRSVIKRQSIRIDAALAKGYSYDEVASVFSEQGIKCKGSTLKKYHLQAKKKGLDRSLIPKLPEKTKSSKNNSTQNLNNQCK